MIEAIFLDKDNKGQIKVASCRDDLPEVIISITEKADSGEEIFAELCLNQNDMIKLSKILYLIGE